MKTGFALDLARVRRYNPGTMPILVVPASKARTWTRVRSPHAKNSALGTLHSALVAILPILLCSCATTTVKQTWKSPNCPPGPVKKVAVVVVADQTNVRPGLENRFAHDIKQQGQAAMATVELLSLTRIKENKEEAAKLLREAGADSILIVRLVDKATYNGHARATGGAMTPVVTGFAGYGWYGYYQIGFMDLSAHHYTLRDDLFMESSLFDLSSGERLWSSQSKTVVKETADKLVIADELVAKVTEAMRKDGVIR